jgi:hypothetical protein
MDNCSFTKDAIDKSFNAYLTTIWKDIFIANKYQCLGIKT